MAAPAAAGGGAGASAVVFDQVPVGGAIVAHAAPSEAVVRGDGSRTNERYAILWHNKYLSILEAAEGGPGTVTRPRRASRIAHAGLAACYESHADHLSTRERYAIVAGRIRAARRQLKSETATYAEQAEAAKSATKRKISKRNRRACSSYEGSPSHSPPNRSPSPPPKELPGGPSLLKRRRLSV